MLKGLTTIIRRVAREVLLPPFERGKLLTDIREGARNTATTEQFANAALLRALKELDPTADIIAEETAPDAEETKHLLKTSPRLWLVDPLDGTRNYQAGRPSFGIAINLVEGGNVSHTALYDVCRDRFMLMSKKPGIFDEHGNRIDLETPRLAAGQLFGAPVGSIGGPENGNTFELPGCASLELMAWGQGRVDFVAHKTVRPWDQAAGLLIAEKRGYIVQNFDGAPYQLASWGEGGAIFARSNEDARRVAALIRNRPYFSSSFPRQS